MSGAEMTIRLVDGTEAEQAAFDRSPTDAETGNVPTAGGIQSPPTQRSELVEAIATGFATIDQEAKQNDFAYNSTESVAAVQQQLAAIANGTNKDKPSEQPNAADGIAGGSEGPTRDDIRELRLAMIELAQKFTPKFFADPIERLILALGPKDEPAKNEPAATTGEESTEQQKTAPVPAVGHVSPKQEDGTTEPASQPASIGDMFDRFQHSIGKTRIGQRVNTVIDRVKKVGGIGRKVASSIGRAIGKTKTGRAVAGFARNAASRVAQSGFGKAVAGAGRAVGGAIARTVGSVAGGAVVSGGTASVAAAGGTTAAAGAATAAGAAALANPVGLAVGAVVASFAGLALATKVLNDTFTSEADRLEKFSAQIAIARGMGKISTELNMIDRAKKLDGPLGNLESSKAALNSAMERLWTEILVLLSGWAPILGKGVDTLTLLAAETRKGLALVESGNATNAAIAAAQTPDPTDDAPAIARAATAAKNLADAMILSKEAFDRLVGNAPANQPGGDPFLRSLLNAKVGP